MNRDIRAGIALLAIGGFLFILALASKPEPGASTLGSADDTYELLRILGLIGLGVGVLALVTGLVRSSD